MPPFCEAYRQYTVRAVRIGVGRQGPTLFPAQILVVVVLVVIAGILQKLVYAPVFKGSLRRRGANEMGWRGCAFT